MVEEGFLQNVATAMTEVFGTRAVVKKYRKSKILNVVMHYKGFWWKLEFRMSNSGVIFCILRVGDVEKASSFSSIQLDAVIHTDGITAYSPESFKALVEEIELTVRALEGVRNEAARTGSNNSSQTSS